MSFTMRPMNIEIHDNLLASIEALYDCVGNEYDRERAVKIYSQVADNSGVIFVDMNMLLGSTSHLHWSNVEDEAIKSFFQRYKCPARDKIIKMITDYPPCVPLLRQSAVSEEEWLNSQLYKRGSERWGFHSHGVSYISGKLLTKTFCFFHRLPDQDPIDAETLSMLAILNNHLHRALNFQNRIDRLEEALIKSNNVLDLIEFGLVLYDINKKPVFINAAAQRILDKKDGLRLEVDEIKIRDRIVNQQFQSLIATIYNSDTPAINRSGGLISVPRLSRLRPYSLMITPMQSQTINIENVTVAVFIFDPGQSQGTTIVDLFSSSYELTSTEAELAHYLMLGHSLDEISQVRGVTRNTVKTQLQSIFSKTETNRQSELVSLLLRSAAGISLKI